MESTQIITMVVYALIIAATAITLILKVNKSVLTKDEKLKTFLLKFSEDIIRISRSVITSLEIKPEDYSTEYDYKQALSTIIAKDFKVFLETSLPEAEYKDLLKLLDEKTLTNLVILLLDVKVNVEPVVVKVPTPEVIEKTKE